MKKRFKKVTVKHTKAWSSWQMPIMTNYQMACCDCGLVHTINFQVVKANKFYKDGSYVAEKMPKKYYRVAMKAKRNEKLTKEQRKK